MKHRSHRRLGIRAPALIASRRGAYFARRLRAKLTLARQWVKRHPAWMLAALGVVLTFTGIYTEWLKVLEYKPGDYAGFIENLAASVTALGVSLTIGAPILGRMFRRITMQPWRGSIDEYERELQLAWKDIATILMPEHAERESLCRQLLIRQAREHGVPSARFSHNVRDAQSRLFRRKLEVGTFVEPTTLEILTYFSPERTKATSTKALRTSWGRLYVRRYLRLVALRATSPMGVLRWGTTRTRRRPVYLDLDRPSSTALTASTVWEQPPLPVLGLDDLSYGKQERSAEFYSLDGFEWPTDSNLEILKRWAKTFTAMDLLLGTSPIGPELGLAMDSLKHELAITIHEMTEWPSREREMLSTLERAPEMSIDRLWPVEYYTKQAQLMFEDYVKTTDLSTRHSPLDSFHQSSVDLLNQLLSLLRQISRA